MLDKIDLNNTKNLFYITLILMFYAVFTSYSRISSGLFVGENLPFLEIDSYWFLYQAKSILENIITFNFNELYNYDLYSYLMALTALLTGFNLELISFYSPAFISALIAIPLVLLFNGKYRIIGLLMAVILFSSNFFTFRTSIGFSDTDSGIIFFIILFIYALLNKNKYFIFIVALLFHWWYLNAIIILSPILFIYCFYNYKIIDKKELLEKTLFAVAALLPIYIVFKIMIFIILVLLNIFYKDLFTNRNLFILNIVFTLFLFSSIFIKVFNKFNYYFYPVLESFGNIPKLTEDSARVGETRIVDFYTMISNIGLENMYLNGLSFIGFILGLIYLRSIFILFLPVLLLGLGGLLSGIRFFLYLEIPLAAGLAFLIYFILSKNKIIGFVSLFIITAFSFNNAISELKVDLMQNTTTKETYPYLKDISLSISKDSNVIMSNWHYGHAISFYSEGLVSRNGAYHTALMNYFSSKYLLSINEDLFVNGFNNYFYEYRTLINEDKKIFSIDKFIKKSFNGDYFESHDTNKDLFILIPTSIKSENLFKEIEVANKLIKIDPIKSKNKGTFSYIDNNKPVNLLINSKDIYSYYVDNKEIILNKEGNLKMFFSDKYIVTYDKSIENTIFIKLLKGESNRFQLEKSNKEFILFKLKK